MAKKAPLETDLTRLKEKVRARVAAVDKPDGDPKLRPLHKRLKRIQRKLRSLADRKRRAMGKASAAEKGSAPTA